MTAPLLEIAGLRVAAKGAPSPDAARGDETPSAGAGGPQELQILRGIDLVVGAGEVHALMGPNGAGKSTLAATLMGHPTYAVVDGTVRFKGEDITHWATDARAKAGLFLAFQYPEAIEGVSVVQFLRQAISARKGQDVLY